jgi:tetratricopeptide (TPR) repeat protein
MHSVAITYDTLRRHIEAQKLFEETLALQKATLGSDHPDTLRCMGNLAHNYASLGRHAEALKLREESLAQRKAKLGPEHPDTLVSMHNLAACYAAVRRHAEALKLHEKTFALMKAKLGPEHPHTIRSMSSLANTLAVLHRHAEALKLREVAFALRKARLGLDHPDTLLNMGFVAESLLKLDRGAEAVPLIDECVTRAAGKTVDSRMVPMLLDLRLRHFEKAGDPAGCRATAAMFENLQRNDAASLYNAARFRAVAAAVQAKGPAADAARLAGEDADRAMKWLTLACAAGYEDRARMEKDRDLDSLRDRDDFKELLAQLKAAKVTSAKSQYRSGPRKEK